MLTTLQITDTTVLIENYILSTVNLSGRKTQVTKRGFSPQSLVCSLIRFLSIC